MVRRFHPKSRGKKQQAKLRLSCFILNEYKQPHEKRKTKKKSNDIDISIQTPKKTTIHKKKCREKIEQGQADEGYDPHDHSWYLYGKVNRHVRPLLRRHGFMYTLGYPSSCLRDSGVQLADLVNQVPVQPNEHHALDLTCKHPTAQVTNDVGER